MDIIRRDTSDLITRYRRWLHKTSIGEVFGHHAAGSIIVLLCLLVLVLAWPMVLTIGGFLASVYIISSLLKEKFGTPHE